MRINSDDFEPILTSRKYPFFRCAFSSNKIECNQTVTGGLIRVDFGSFTLDMSDTMIMNGAVIRVLSYFSSVKIYTHGMCKITTNGFVLLGRVKNSSEVSDEDDLPVVRIDYTCICGNIQIF